jgi:hypothetical protein
LVQGAATGTLEKKYRYTEFIVEFVYTIVVGEDGVQMRPVCPAAAEEGSYSGRWIG